MALIVIYDSGVGGLSIYQEVIERSPYHDYVFVSDNAAFPYGTKSDGELIPRVIALCSVIAEKYQPDVLVVACNTASTVALSQLRDKFSFDIVGVVPAIKPAAQMSVSKVIGLLATPATVDRYYTQRLISDFAGGCQTITLGSSELVQIAEDKLHGESVDHAKIATILAPILNTDSLDTLVLACTHFPLLRDEIKRIFDENNRSIDLVDSGSAIAKRVQHFVESYEQDSNARFNRIAVFTRPLESTRMRSHLMRIGFAEPEHLIL